MQLTLRAPVVVVSVDSPRAAALVVFSVRLVRSAMLSYVVFISHLYPTFFLRWAEKPFVLFARAIELPMSLVGLVVPRGFRPFSTWFPDPMAWIDTVPLWRNYLLVGVPMYLVLTYAFAGLIPRLRRGPLSGRRHG
jgi:hypothetical protein